MKISKVFCVAFMAVALSFCLASCGDKTSEKNVAPENVVAVDLGLPSGTLWANMNVGANAPEEYGDYFAWGEPAGYNSGKTTFSWSTYSLCNGSDTIMTKYSTSSGFGTLDNKTELDPEDDAAYVNWGKDWRMPSVDQIEELCNECTWTWSTMNSVEGYSVTGPSGNSIFLPATRFREGNSLDGPWSDGFYWSRTLQWEYSDYACCLYFNSSKTSWDFCVRYRGQSVRPVRNK